MYENTCTADTVVVYRSFAIDGFQMSVKCPTSGGQVRNQEAAVYSEPFTLRETTSTNGKDSK